VPETKLLTTQEVADRLRMPKATLRYWRHQGQGPKGVKLGNRVLYREVDVETFIAEQWGYTP
jgi:excisionase family DNA binding protein